MSLDGFVAEPDDSVPHIFDWFDTGAVRFDWPGDDMVSDRDTELYAVRK
jgi:hypothetical protein